MKIEVEHEIEERHEFAVIRKVLCDGYEIGRTTTAIRDSHEAAAKQLDQEVNEFLGLDSKARVKQVRDTVDGFRRLMDERLALMKSAS